MIQHLFVNIYQVCIPQLFMVQRLCVSFQLRERFKFVKWKIFTVFALLSFIVRVQQLSANFFGILWTEVEAYWSPIRFITLFVRVCGLPPLSWVLWDLVRSDFWLS
jgi:hypothetical protein